MKTNPTPTNPPTQGYEVMGDDGVKYKTTLSNSSTETNEAPESASFVKMENLPPNHTTEPMGEKWEEVLLATKTADLPKVYGYYLRGKVVITRVEPSQSVQEAKALQHSKSFTEGYNRGRESGIADEKKWVDKNLQEAKAERDREWMMGMYKMFGSSKGGSIGMAILSSLKQDDLLTSLRKGEA